MLKNLLTIAALSALTFSAVSCISQRRATAGKRAYNITTYGAKPGGQDLCTDKIQKAVDTCSREGGGRVVIPEGVWLTGTLVLKDNVELHLASGATVQGSTNHVDYPTFHPGYRSHKDINGFNALIYAEKAANIALTGNGVIDGRGSDQRPRDGTQFCGDTDGRPRNILLISCKNVRVDGISMKNSGVWNQHYLNCEDLLIENIRVYNHANRNNDGIDIDGCRRVVFRNSVIDSDDDGICLKSTGPAACEYVTISNCTASSHCNAIKTGTESTGGFKHVQISDIVVKPCAPEGKVVYGRAEGITGITVGCVDGGICEDITIRDITIEGTLSPIFVRLGKRNRPHTPGAEVTADSTMSNIVISNVTATGCGDWGCAILGLPGNPIQNLQLRDITLSFAGGGTEEDSKREIKEGLTSYPQPTAWGKLPAYGLFIRNVNAISLKNISMKTVQEDARPPVWLENIEGAVLSDAKANGARVATEQIIRRNVSTSHEK